MIFRPETELSKIIDYSFYKIFLAKLVFFFQVTYAHSLKPATIGNLESLIFITIYIFFQ